MSDTTAQKETADQALARALNAAKLRRINEAIGICRDLLAATPDLAGALGLLGGILGQEGRADEAIELLRAAVAKQPNVGNWHLNLCALYRGRNMLDEALAAGLDAIRTSPDTAAHRVELALTHLTRGERDLASLRYREAMGREPEHPAAHMGLGELLLSLGEYGPGWMEYAWRNKLDQARGTLPKMTAALLERHGSPGRHAAAGSRPGLRRHDPVRPLHSVGEASACRSWPWAGARK